MTGRRAGGRVLSSLAIAVLLAGCSASATPTPAPATPTPAPLPTVGVATPTPAPLPASLVRVGQTATLLSDGRVLIVAGFDGTAMLASAEIYDPKTGTFTATGSLAPGASTEPFSARSGHTAALLSDGRVLVAGGSPDGGTITALAGAQIFDPATGKFTATGSMSTARFHFTATLLSDGRVLVVGGCGFGSASNAPASAEIYDPRTGTFSPTGSMSTARCGAAATLLSDGSVLIAGGTPDNTTFLASAELFDPKTGTFSPTGSMATARGGSTATLLSDGDVLVVGGTPDGPKILASAELFDPKTGTFSPTGSMATARKAHTATLLSDGRVLVAGGWGSSNILSSAELYDPKTGTFSPTGSMATARQYQTATLLSTGDVLIVGGGNDVTQALASAELYNPKTGTFSPTGP